MDGERVLKHPNVDTINEMFENGHTARDVEAWLKQAQKHKRLQISAVTLQHYRKNFLNLTRKEVNEKRKEMKKLGKSHDELSLTYYGAAKDLADAKTAIAKEMEKSLQDFNAIRGEVLDAIAVIREQHTDQDGNRTFHPRSYEVLEKFLGRLESTTNSFLKAHQDLQKSNSGDGGPAGQTNINISTAQMDKYAEVFKETVKSALLEMGLTPEQMNQFLDIYRTKLAKVFGEEEESEIKIQIDNNNSTNNINIVTSLPTAEQADEMADSMSNENTDEDVVEIEAQPELDK